MAYGIKDNNVPQAASRSVLAQRKAPNIDAGPCRC